MFREGSRVRFKLGDRPPFKCYSCGRDNSSSLIPMLHSYSGQEFTFIEEINRESIVTRCNLCFFMIIPDEEVEVEVELPTFRIKHDSGSMFDGYVTFESVYAYLNELTPID